MRTNEHEISPIGQILEACMVVATMYILFQATIYLVLIAAIVMMIISKTSES